MMPARMLGFMKRPAVVVAISVLILRGLTLASRFLLSLLLARTLSPEEMGSYGLITGVLAFALLGLGLEFYSYMFREMVPASPERRVQIIADQTSLGAATFVVAVILTLLAVFAGFFPPSLALWFVLVLLAEHGSLEATRFLIIMSRPVRAYMVVFLRGALWVYAIAILMFTVPSSRSLETVLICWAVGGASSIIFAAVSLSDLPWRMLRKRAPDWAWISAGLRTARPFMVTAGAALSITYIDRFIIDKFAGREALGIYTFYSTIAIGMLSLGAALSQQFLPKVISAYAVGPEAYSATLRAFFWTLFALAGGMVILAALAMWPMLFLFGLSTYQADIWVFYFMLPGILLRSLADVPSYALYATRSDGYLLLCNLGAALVSALLNILLVPAFGLYGAALTSGVASAALFLSMAFLAVRRLREHHRLSSATSKRALLSEP
jgi:O-antigen/teichoic acid export membrane protein